MNTLAVRYQNSLLDHLAASVLPVAVAFALVLFCKDESLRYQLAGLYAVIVGLAWRISPIRRNERSDRRLMRWFGVTVVAALPALALAWLQTNVGSEWLVIVHRGSVVLAFVMIGINWMLLHDWEQDQG